MDRLEKIIFEKRFPIFSRRKRNFNWWDEKFSARYKPI
jgi:hypothetical protein